MRRNNQNNDYRYYSYIPPSSSTSSRNSSSLNTHYQYYDHRLRPQQTIHEYQYSNRTPTNVYSSPHTQHHYQTPTTIPNLNEPISIFDELIPSIHHRSNITPLPSTYIPPNPSRRSSVNDIRLATANAKREQLLTDIQTSIHEINEELSTLERRPSIAHRLSPLVELDKRQIKQTVPILPSPIYKKIHLSTTEKQNNEDQLWLNKPKRIYEVIPRLTSQSKKISDDTQNDIEISHSTPKLTSQFTSYSFIGQYHYGPETEEIEILENDPENIDLKSTTDEIHESSIHEIFSIDQFLRPQSTLSQNRAIICVPEYGDNNDIEIIESVKDLNQNDPLDINTARSLTSNSLHDLVSTSKLNIQDFEILIQTAPEYNTNQKISQNTINPHELHDKIESNLFNENNPMLSKPVKHSHLSTRILSDTQQSIINPNTDGSLTYFFSDFGNEGEGEEDLISIDPSHFSVPTGSDIIIDDNMSTKSIRQSQVSLVIPHSIHVAEQQLTSTIPLTIQNIKETEKKKDIVTTTPSLLSKQVIPISIIDNMQTQSTRNNNNSNEEQEQTLTTTMSNMNRINSKIEQQENTLNNLQIRLHSPSISIPSTSERKTSAKKIPLKTINSTDQRPISSSRILTTTSIDKQSHSNRQRSASLRHSSKNNQSFNTLSRHQSITSIDNKQQTSTESRRSSTTNSELSVPLNSPDFNNDRPSTSKATTPERRNSISSIDQNILLTTNDIIDFEDPSIIISTDNFQTSLSQQPSIDREEPSPLENIISFQEFPVQIQDQNQSDEDELQLPPTSLDIDVHHPSDSPSFLYPIHHENLMHRTSSPSLSTHEYKEEQTNRLKSVSPLIVETKQREYENSSSNFEHDELRLPSISPHHSELSDDNITSVEREDTFRQPLSSDHNNNHYQNEISTSPPLEPKVITEHEKLTSLAHLDHGKEHSSSSPLNEEELPSITASQRRSKLSLLVRQQKSKGKKSLNDQLPQINKLDFSSINNDEKQQNRHVLFSNNISHHQMKEENHLKNWRNRIDSILIRNHFSNQKYSHIQSRVNSFANFEYQPRKFNIISKKKSRSKHFNTGNNKLKKLKIQSDQEILPVKGPTRQLFGRLYSLTDGRSRIFHETLNWNVESKIKSYSLENLHHKPSQNDFKIFDKKPKWHSESKLADLIKSTPRRQMILLSTIQDKDEPYFHPQEPETEKKIYDVHLNGQQSKSRLQENVLIKSSDKIIFDEKLVWIKKSKLKDSIWQNINYQSKKSKIQIIHKPVHWNNESKIQTQIVEEKLSLDTQVKVKYWSKNDFHQLRKKKALFAQYFDPKWKDIITASIDSKNNNYPKILSDQIISKQNLKLNDYGEINSNNPLDDQTEQETPPNRPKWNSVSKTRSVNTVYNPKQANLNLIRSGWDFELRRKRVHKLPPLKRKRDHDKIPQLAIESPPSNNQLAIDYHHDHSLTTNECTTSIDYGTLSSRRSSKALVPLRRFPELELLSETSRSQRPVQQEWYDELSKSRLTNRTDIGQTANNSSRLSILSIHQTNTPREHLTLRSLTRNSQNSVISGTLIDSSIRTNRATELRLSRDMDEHHHHSHTPSQSMPIEIRGFRLEGTQLTVPDNATIRPLSNISYRTSERVKNHRIYPWSNLHSHGTSSRNSFLVPIAELRHPSFETNIMEIPQLVHEE